jgi:hypothetical protein
MMDEIDPLMEGMEKSKFNLTEIELKAYLQGLIHYSQPLIFNVGMGEDKMTNGSLTVSVKSLNVGAKLGFLQYFSLLAGYQTLNSLATDGILEMKNNETMLLAGLETKLSEGSYLYFEYGSQKTVVGMTNLPEESFTRDLLNAEIRVKF